MNFHNEVKRGFVTLLYDNKIGISFGKKSGTVDDWKEASENVSK